MTGRSYNGSQRRNQAGLPAWTTGDNMKITFLGTSAGEEYPGIWCECPNCSKARGLGGKNIRRNSAIVVDGDAMVDIGKTAHIQAERFGINIKESISRGRRSVFLS